MKDDFLTDEVFNRIAEELLPEEAVNRLIADLEKGISEAIESDSFFNRA